MRKLLLVALLLCMGAVICGGPVATLAADKPVEISTCWMDESPGFNIWYAKKMGWDKEEGLDIKMLLFNSGPAQMEALPRWKPCPPRNGCSVPRALAVS